MHCEEEGLLFAAGKVRRRETSQVRMPKGSQLTPEFSQRDVHQIPSSMQLKIVDQSFVLCLIVTLSSKVKMLLSEYFLN